MENSSYIRKAIWPKKRFKKREINFAKRTDGEFHHDRAEVHIRDRCIGFPEKY